MMPEGKIFGGCRVGKLLGRGASGEIYEATQLSLDRRVALKVLASEASGELEKLLGEARTLGQIDHPNVVRVYNAGSEEGRGFLLMELLEGETLFHRLRRERALPVAESLRIASGVSRGLTAAHRLGIIHRDLKPSNIFLRTDGRPKLVDFGLATGGVHGGTPEFMAPEQWRRQPVDPRTDLYALGLVLYHMIAGRAAFEGDVDQLRHSHLDLVLRPPSPRPPGWTEQVFSLIWKLSRKQPKDRYRDAVAFLSDLEAMRAGLAPTAFAEMGRVVLCPTCDTESPAGTERCPDCQTDLSRLHMTTEDLLPEPPPAPKKKAAPRPRRRR